VAAHTTVEYCELSDIGRRRANNQDAKAVVAPWSREQYRRRGWLFVAADGMGAHAAGEMASAIAAEQVPLQYEKLAHRSPPLALKIAIEHTNAEIHARGETSPDLRGMGTTCTAVALVPRGVLVGHVGDSRAYRIRGTAIEQLSRDHSLAWEVEAARGGRDDGVHSPPKNIITRSLGPHPHVQVDIEGPFPVESGDVYVVCSDGLSGQVTDQEIGLVAGGLPPPAAGAMLVGLALVRGAPDNVTVIVARTGEKEISKASAEDGPWPLALDDDDNPRTPRPLPWRTLGVAAGSLFVAMLFYKESLLMNEAGPIGRLLGPLREPVSWVGFGGLLMVFLVALMASFLGFLAPRSAAVRVLPPGARLGGGPYRRYDCTPSADLVTAMLASVETAADGLADREREESRRLARRARDEAAGGDPQAALRTLAEAVAIYSRSVEAARSDATTRLSG